MKKLFTHVAAAFMAVGAYAQYTPTQSLHVMGFQFDAAGTTDWNHGAEMTNNNGTYTYTSEGVTLEAGTNYEFKVREGDTDGDWSLGNWGDNENLNADGTPSNVKASVPETAVYTVTITLTPTSASTPTPTFQYKKTGNAGEITHTYTVAGSPEAFFGSNWKQDDANNDMTLVDDPNSDYDGLYTLERNFAAEASTDFEFKVVQDHAWGVAYPASNATGNIPNAGTYKVVISYDPTSHAVEFHATANADGIDAVKTVTVNTDNRIFNLAGQQVTKAYKGVVVKNGKKYIQ